jgi:hypothetical protein
VEIEQSAVVFRQHLHTFRGQIVETWGDWIVVLSVRACRKGIALMQDFQISYDATLVTKLSM